MAPQPQPPADASGAGAPLIDWLRSSWGSGLPRGPQQAVPSSSEGDGDDAFATTHSTHGASSASCDRAGKSPGTSLGRTLGLSIAVATGLAVSGVMVFGLPFMVVPWLPRKLFGALPYLPTGPTRLNTMLDRVPPPLTRPGRRFLDLGSGDGEAVLAAAHRGMHAHGVELNPSLVALSKWRAWRAGHAPPACSFTWGNLLDARAGGYSVVFVFGVVPLMPRIAAKLAAECDGDAYVCTHKFPLPGAEWERAKVDELIDVHIYDCARLPQRRACTGTGTGLS